MQQTNVNTDKQKVNEFIDAGIRTKMKQNLLSDRPSNIATFLRILGEGNFFLGKGLSIGMNTLGWGETILTGGLGLLAGGGDVSLNSFAIGVRRSEGRGAVTCCMFTYFGT